MVGMKFKIGARAAGRGRRSPRLRNVASSPTTSSSWSMRTRATPVTEALEFLRLHPR